jgi:UDP-2,4-diacetamido-2,4,6-trideoxy-beta-L-altropyranose hydrolase
MEIKPEVFIRADGSPTIGLGHLVRCSALAHMLKTDFQIAFFCKEIPDTLAGEFVAAGFGLKKINTEEEYFQQLKPKQIAVLDGYDFNTEYQRKVRNKGCGLVCIDDLHDREFVADLIINHAPGITQRDYKTQPYTRFALGPEYALLRPTFLEQAKKKRKIEKIETLLIAFGGADPKGLTKKTVKIAIQFPEFKKIIVVTGASFTPGSRFAEMIASDQRIEQRINLNEKEMLSTMIEADLAIVPSSGVLFEVLAAGCKTISGFYTDNQLHVYQNFKRSGSIIDAGHFDDAEIEEALKTGLKNGTFALKPIDGDSKLKIRKTFSLLKREYEVILRPAVQNDLEITFAWATNPEIRRFAFQNHQISSEEHTQWFFGKINDPLCKFFIGEISGRPFGSIRFDINNNEAIISYLVDPAFHGQNLGQILLKKGIESLLSKKNLESKAVFNIISGFVMKPNIPSIKAFERLGFEKIDFEDRYKFVKTI